MSNLDSLGTNEFGIPSAFGSDPDEATLAALHVAGFDAVQIRYDAVDIFPNDIDLAPDPAVWESERLPQFGPQFVRFVNERFGKLEKLMLDSMERWQWEPVTAVYPASMNTDGTGAVGRNVQNNAVLAEPPPGFTFKVHRFSIFAAGFTFGAPFNGAGGYWELRINDEFVDGGSLVTPAAGVAGGILPVVKTWGTRDAIPVRDGEVLSLFMSGGPATTKLTCKTTGTLDRVIEG
jgi:hypothetical protein